MQNLSFSLAIFTGAQKYLYGTIKYMHREVSISAVIIVARAKLKYDKQIPLTI